MCLIEPSNNKTFPFSFRATLYPCPETPAERREMAVGVMTRIEDLQTVSEICYNASMIYVNRDQNTGKTYLWGSRRFCQ